MVLSYNPNLSAYFLESNSQDMYDLIESYYYAFCCYRNFQLLTDKARYAVRLEILLSSAVKVLTDLNFYQLDNLKNYLVEVRGFLEFNKINRSNYVSPKF